MTTYELRDLYNKCCDTKAFVPDKHQLEEWRAQIGHLDKQDLSGAIDEWFRESSAFPTPADLRQKALRSQRAREARNIEKRRFVLFSCAICGYTMSSYVANEDDLLRSCPSIYSARGVFSRSLPPGQTCGAEMQHRVVEAA